MTKKQKKMLARILVCAVMLIALQFLPITGIPRFALYLAAYLVIGFDILKKAAKGIGNGRVFDENFLMAVATVPDALGSFFENIKANDKVRGKVQREAGNSRDGEKLQGNEHHGADENAREHLFLFLCHGEQLLLSLSKCLIVWAKAAPQNGAQFSMASYSSISQSGSTFLQALRTSFITDLASAPSANSTIIFCVMKLTVAFATPSVLLAASSMRLAQLAQSTSIA